jgi:CBS domain-containing protein
MRIRDIMTRGVATCSPHEPVSAALQRLWEGDCGVLPVVEEGRVTSVVTDRDLAMALVLKASEPQRLAVGEVVHGRLYTCRPQETVSVALERMARHRVRRLPVVDGDELVGIVSMNDIVRAAAAHRGAVGRPTYAEVLKAYRETCLTGSRTDSQEADERGTGTPAAGHAPTD